MNQQAWAGILKQVASLFQKVFSETAKVLRGFLNRLEGQEERRASGLSQNSIFTSMRHFCPSVFAHNQLSRHLSPPRGQESLQRRDHIIYQSQKI